MAPKGMNHAMAILDNIDERAAQVDLTLPDVARLAGVAWSSVWRVRNGHSAGMSTATLDKMESALRAIEAQRARGVTQDTSA